MKVVYIAGPFRATNPDGTNDAWRTQQHIMKAMALALDVWKLGHAAVCPHANTMFFQNAAADNVWLDGDLEMLRRCDAVLMVEGFENSKGATAEAVEAMKEGIPAFTTLDELRSWLDRGAWAPFRKIFLLGPRPEMHK